MPIPPSKYKEYAEREELKAMLAEWYGAPEGSLEIISHDKEIRTLAELNDEFLKQVINANTYAQIELAAKWEEIVSPQFAALVKFSSLDENGVLFLEIKHSAFLQEELLKSADLLLNRINSKFGENICKELRFVPSGRRSFASNRNNRLS